MQNNNEELRLKLMLVKIIETVLSNDYHKVVELVQNGTLKSDWVIYPIDYPNIVACTFWHKNSPLWSFSLAPELKNTLADYFSKSLSQRINTEYKQTIVEVKKDILKQLKQLKEDNNDKRNVH
jgi:hypothetical protein